MVTTKPYHTDEWRHALAVAEAVKESAHDLTLEPRMEWLRQVIGEAADQMRSAVLWAASQTVPDPASRGTAGLRPLIIAADAARSDAALASYFLSFLGHEQLLGEGQAQTVVHELQAVEAEMDALSRQMRTELGFDPYSATGE